jgi:hypothetical protein
MQEPNYMKEKIPNFGGFVIYDDAHKYRVDLPDGWSERASRITEPQDAQK